MNRSLFLWAGPVVAVLVSVPTPVDACGCLSPPVPPPDVVDEQGFAVNQQSEQIIFEVPGDGTVTAHVLIRYAGQPESFAWIVPVPSAPELALSEASAFALLEQGTAPLEPPPPADLCSRQPAFQCRQHTPITCGDSRGGGGGFGCSFGDDAPAFAADAGLIFSDASAGSAADASMGPAMPPVDVIDRAVIGSYETITFGAADTAAAVTWLQDEGFIVNDTMAPYMQPYADAGMLFVASRLVPGAGVDSIRPLRMTFESDNPMIPLVLTAVAAEPHLTVTAYIYGEQFFEALDHPEIDVPDQDIVSVDGRSSYPMTLARLIDEAGGDAFVAEYRGEPYVPQFGGTSGCCADDVDRCGVGGDRLCQCPLSEFDTSDCEELSIGAGAELLVDLASRYRSLTRLTTRLSAEEMTFDPAFGPSETAISRSRILPTSGGASLDGCFELVVPDDREAVEAASAQQACATTYCGAGECVITAVGPACACQAGYVARRFVDLDGLSSITCVPDTPPVDYAAGGLELPDACAGVDCAAGTCVDVGGFPTCRCDGLAAAVLRGTLPSCVVGGETTGTPGAMDYTQPVADASICAARPPTTCGDMGWLERNRTLPPNVVLCDSSMPDPALLEVPPAPTCPDEGGCSIGQRGVPIIWLPLLGIVALFVMRRSFGRA